MFSFHKPRVYRSTEGCCICRAKSSSSRFTDSQKYEEDSMKCFNLTDPRHGEICNACVLLVKRYKRLPAGSQRHWGHVVDARAGPGTKTLTKIKRSKEEIISDNSNNRSNHVQTGRSVISEKFSKIFKKSKNKKLKLNSIEQRDSKKTAYKSPQKLHSKMTLFKRPNSLDSDNEHSRESSPGPNGSHNVVQFQTQTRASYRSKNNAKENHMRSSVINRSTVTRKTSPKISGSKRRKKLLPQKNRASIDSNIKFFDDIEWSKRTTCCGIVYECAKLPGAEIIDLDSYKPCQDHQQCETPAEQKAVENHDAGITENNIKATFPAIVKLNLPLKDSSANINPTPVLKKHHLFYKRQSESFPQIDISTTGLTKSKTECNSKELSVFTNNIQSSTETNLPEPTGTATLKMQTTVCGTALANLPRSSKVSTIVNLLDNPMLSSDAKNSIETKSCGLLHRIKSDAGKIVKHSIEKLNSAVRSKAHDLSDIRSVVKTVDKNYILPKKNISIAGPPNSITAATLNVPDLSPTSSSTKFSDNSSDSGFDENVQDRKSASPLQQENDTKIMARPPVQTVILTSGAQGIGQQQNAIYAGKEAITKTLKTCMQTQKTLMSSANNNNSAILQHNKRLNLQSLAIDPSTTLKIVQAKNNCNNNNNNNRLSTTSYRLGVGPVKIRALYNNNNAIQHENGITTIVPASSVAAIKHVDTKMQPIAPNTVTITPSSSSSQMKLSLPANSMSTNYQYCESNANNNQLSSSQLNLNNINSIARMNQKFILLKTNPSTTTFGHNYNNSNNNNSNSSDFI